jgi:hypothetical protein
LPCGLAPDAIVGSNRETATAMTSEALQDQSPGLGRCARVADGPIGAT